MAEIKSDVRVIGILAHVDSGKTTLAEALLYHSGTLRTLGRVDHGDAFLDSEDMERKRGITIFSKIGRMKLEGSEAVLLDTPGHTDFSPEMERALSVLDYCVLVVNGADGVTTQTKKLWKLLEYYEVPVFVFVNKMDQVTADRESLYAGLQKELSDHIQSFDREDLLKTEELAVLSEKLLEEYLAEGFLEEEAVRDAILDRDIFPCYFGSALKGTGVAEFYEGLARWTTDFEYPEEFAARVFKIARDEQGRRLTELKITGGSLKNKTVLGLDKINELRLYSGKAYEVVQEVFAGQIAGVVGLKETKAGQGLGAEEEDITPTIAPVISYRVILEEGGDPSRLLTLLRQIEEELPELAVTYEEETSQIFVHIMGEVLLEVLTDLVEKRGGMKIGVDEGRIIYRETVTKPVIGIGHFEPLRHYAEVQLLLESGEEPDLETRSVCDQNTLAANWQHLILSHVHEKEHKGVLIGSPLTKLRITLVSGRAHVKHTAGGDFREATYRAIRQGLMEARSRGGCAVLEPYYEFEIRTPKETSGRILTDLSRLSAAGITTIQAGDQSVISGRAPVATMRGYARELVSVTHGMGQIHFESGGYDLCHNAEEVIAQTGYEPGSDLANPSGSIFTAQGAGLYVPWNEVYQKAHIPPFELSEKRTTGDAPEHSSQRSERGWIDPAEVDRIINSIANANANEKKKWKETKKHKSVSHHPRGTPLQDPSRPTYLLVDGYNVVHAWSELEEVARVSFDAARDKLTELLQDYQGYCGENIILVFDAYKVTGGAGSQDQFKGLTVVYTRENETADRYIERRAMELAKNFQVKVVTSDAAEQLSASGSGALVYSARRFKEIVDFTTRAGKENYERNKEPEDRLRPFKELLAQEKEGDENPEKGKQTE